MPVLTGMRFFCLANRESLVFTNIFGGASEDEGLGLLAFSLDWQYIGTSAIYTPLITLTNDFVGFAICTGMFIALNYGKVWNALQFPFLSQELFSQTSNSSAFLMYNQSAILNAANELHPSTFETIGFLSFSTTNASNLLTPILVSLRLSSTSFFGTAISSAKHSNSNSRQQSRTSVLT
jgi:hypothetical protein